MAPSPTAHDMTETPPTRVSVPMASFTKDAKKGANQGGNRPRASLLGQIPRWMNQISRLLQPNQSRQRAASELHLFFAPNPTCGQDTFWAGVPWMPNHPLMSHIQPEHDDKMDLASFGFALSQVPEIQTVTFSGWGEPVNNPDLGAMIRQARDTSNVVTKVYSHGQCEFQDAVRLLEAPLDHLTFQLVATTPSAFNAAFDGQCNLRRYLKRRKLVCDVLRYRNQTRLAKDTFIEVAMVVDTLSVFHLPEMIAQAAGWGADGIRFETRLRLPDPLEVGVGQQQLSRDTEAFPEGELGWMVPEEWLSVLYAEDMVTLFDTHTHVQAFINECRQQDWPIAVSWPTLFRSGEAGRQGLGCPAVNETLSVRPDLRVSNCPRQLAIPNPTNNVWEQRAWQHPECETLRTRHQSDSLAGGKVPVVCHWCPRHP